MTKHRVHGDVTIAYHKTYVWEVEAESAEAAQAKMEELEDEGELPLSEDDIGISVNTDEVRYIEDWEHGDASDDGMKFEVVDDKETT